MSDSRDARSRDDPRGQPEGARQDDETRISGRLHRQVSRGSLCLALFLLVLGSKLSLIRDYSTPSPYWDAWHVEGSDLYKPYLTGHLRLASLFSPVSEHRPLVLRVYGLALLRLNGQWDNQLQMVVNAVLFASFACLLLALLCSSLSSGGRVAMAIAVGLMLTAPPGWENTLNGHHAGWFFFYISSALALWLTTTRRPLGGAWLAGVASVAFAYLSLFAGVITAAAAAATLVLEVIGRRRVALRTLAGAAILLACFFLGMTLEPRFAGQQAVVARSPAAFGRSLGYALVWPCSEITPWSLLLQLPMATFLSLLALGRLRYTPARGFVAALGIWTWLQAAAIAYARGMEGVAPASRYGDVLKIGLLAGLAAALVLLAEGRGRLRLAASVCVVVWLLSLGNGLLHATRDALAFTLPQRGADSRVQDGNLRGFVATGRSGWIDGKAAREIGYYAGSDRLAAILGDSPIRSILPSSIREPLPTSWPDAGTSFGRRFAPAVPQPEDTNVVGTYGDGGPVATGTIQSRLVPAPRLPYLEFRIAGRMGTPDLQLRLTSASGEIITAPVVRSPHRWARLRLRAPDSAFRITLTDTSQDGWLAVSPPREMGRLSYLAAWLIEHELTVRWGGCLCAAVWLLLLVWATFRHGPRHAAATPAGPHGPSPRRGNVEPSDM